MSPRPDPTPSLNAAFGRRRDDRAPLLFAAGVAVIVHVLAILIPLPEPAQPEIPPARPDTGPVIRPTELPPPPEPKEPEAIEIVSADLSDPLPVPPLEELFEAVVEPRRIEAVPAADIVPIDLPTEYVPPPPPIPGDRIVDMTERDLTLPVAIHQPQPDFPEQARMLRKGGRVVLRAVIDRAGNVVEIEVLAAPRPDWGYSEKAIEAVSQWRYRPGEVNGRIVSVRMTVLVEFNLR